jgi:hypothetical protein
MLRKQILVSLCCLVPVGVALGVIAEEYAAEAPAGFTTPTLGQAVSTTGELTVNAGAQSVSNGIAEPPGDTFALDQAQFERRHDPSTGLGPVFNATACAECHQNGVTGAAGQTTEVRAGHKDANGNFVNPTVLINKRGKYHYWPIYHQRPRYMPAGARACSALGKYQDLARNAQYAGRWLCRGY